MTRWSRIRNSPQFSTTHVGPDALVWAAERSSANIFAMTFYRRNLPHLQRDAKPHFITFVTHQRWEMPDWARSIVLDCCLHDHNARYLLHAAVAMPDHAHVILTPMVNQEKAVMFTLAEIMRGIKGTSSHRINRRLGRRGRIWQEESFDRVLRTSEKLDEKIGYVLNNPVRKGLVATVEDYAWIWPRSS